MPEQFWGETPPIFLLVDTGGNTDEKDWIVENYYFPKLGQNCLNLEFDWDTVVLETKKMESGTVKKTYDDYMPWLIMHWREIEDYNFQQFLAKMMRWTGAKRRLIVIPHYNEYESETDAGKGACRRMILCAPESRGQQLARFWKYHTGSIRLDGAQGESTYPAHEYHFDTLVLNGGAERAGLGANCPQAAAAARTGSYGFQLDGAAGGKGSDETNYVRLDSSRKYLVKAKWKVPTYVAGTFYVRAKWYQDSSGTPSSTAYTNLLSQSAQQANWYDLETSIGSGGAHAIPADANYVRFRLYWSTGSAGSTAYVDNFSFIPDQWGWGLIT